MADWSKPTITSDYVLFVDEVKARDVDAITLQSVALVNPPTGAIKLVRSPVKFQEWDGSNFVDRPLSIEGGGTGSTTVSGARGNLGLGTMAYQNSNAIAVTGGTVANLVSSGTLTHTGLNPTFNAMTGGNALLLNGVTGSYGLQVNDPTHGVYIKAGAAAADINFVCQNAAGNTNAIIVTGTMVAKFPNRLVIPVGTDLWAT